MIWPMTSSQRAAGLLAAGLVLTIAAAALLLTAGYLGLTNPTEYLQDPRPGVPFAVAGWVTLTGGLWLLGVGVYRRASLTRP